MKAFLIGATGYIGSAIPLQGSFANAEAASYAAGVPGQTRSWTDFESYLRDHDWAKPARSASAVGSKGK